jgi:hypothetical protein
MWPGPRNISTAMMRSWGNRPNPFVRDEPLDAHEWPVAVASARAMRSHLEDPSDCWASAGSMPAALG